jgi:hypothetical protein
MNKLLVNIKNLVFCPRSEINGFAAIDCELFWSNGAKIILEFGISDFGLKTIKC